MIRNRYTAAITDKPWWLAGGIPRSACIAAYQAKGASSLAASYVNLANPGVYNLTVGNAPNWDSINGWTFVQANTTYLKTGITPSNNQSYSAVVRFSDITSDNCTLIGAVNNSPYPEIKLSPVYQTIYVRYSNGGYKSITPAMTTGVLAVAGNIGYRNGVIDATITAVAGTIPEIYIGARHLWTDSVDEKLGGKIQSVSFYNIPISNYQVNAIGNFMP